MYKIDMEMGESYYPIGYHMQRNLPIIKKLADNLKNLVLDDKLGIFNSPRERIVLCCRGSSGAIISAIVADIIPECIILHIKKEGESAHTSHVYFQFEENDCIVIIDDFIASGATVSEIYKALQSKNKKVHCIAMAGGVSVRSVVEYINPNLFIYST